MRPKFKTNPINIVPFIDVLLVLLVILVVAARFDGSSAQEMAKLYSIIEEQKAKIAALSIEKPKNIAVPTVKTKIVEKQIVAAPVIRTETKIVRDDAQLEEALRRIQDLELEFETAKRNQQTSIGRGENSRGGRTMNITFGENRVLLNGTEVDEQFVLDLVKFTRVPINVSYRSTGKIKAEAFERWASGEGYSFGR